MFQNLLKINQNGAYYNQNLDEFEGRRERIEEKILHRVGVDGRLHGVPRCELWDSLGATTNKMFSSNSVF